MFVQIMSRGSAMAVYLNEHQRMEFELVEVDSELP